MQDIYVQEFFWYWQLLLSVVFKDDGDALTTTNAGRANSILASSSPVERTSCINQSYLMWYVIYQPWYTAHIGYLSSWTRWVVMRVPEAPRGCPMAIAPPLTLLFSGSSPRALATARYWGAKASFTWAKNKNKNSINCKNSVINKSKHKCNAVFEIYKVGYIYSSEYFHFLREIL